MKTLDNKDILDNMNNLCCNCTTSPFTDLNNGKETPMERPQIQGISLH